MEMANVSILQEDIVTGISLYMIGKHCPMETMKLSHFLLQLAKEESLPTIILATVNTLQSGPVQFSAGINISSMVMCIVMITNSSLC